MFSNSLIPTTQIVDSIILIIENILIFLKADIFRVSDNYRGGDNNFKAVCASRRKCNHRGESYEGFSDEAANKKAELPQFLTRILLS